MEIPGSPIFSACSPHSELSSSFGSPGSPPPSTTSSVSSFRPDPGQPSVPVCDQEQPHSNNFENVLGIDIDAMEAELNMRYGWQKGDLETHLTGEELASHLKESNARLASKVKKYRDQCERLESMLQECQQKSQDSVDSIRNFYRNLMYYGTSRGASMLKASYQKKKFLISRLYQN